MFGCVVAGRPIQTNLTQLDETHAYFELLEADSINHICVFLIGTVPFPQDYGAAVHFLWPGKVTQLLGMLSADKPSAVFRLRGSLSIQEGPIAPIALTSASAAGSVAMLGLSIEPLPLIEIQLQSQPTPPTMAITAASDIGTDEVVLLAERIGKNMLNYVSGFVGGGEGMIPLSVFGKWYESFVTKVKTRGVRFLEESS